MTTSSYDIVTAYSNGSTIKQIAAALGISIPHARARLVEAGVDFRPRGFASMPLEARRAISSLGGRAVGPEMRGFAANRGIADKVGREIWCAPGAQFDGLPVGISRTPEYRAWKTMMRRCTNPSASNYHMYGGRGISVCERWHSPANFLADMGKRPDGMSLDRVDNDGGYSPENCRWATPFEQSMNRRCTRRVTAFGETKTAIEWAEQFGLTSDVIWVRIKSGWAAEAAVTAPTVNQVRQAHTGAQCARLKLGI